MKDRGLHPVVEALSADARRLARPSPARCAPTGGRPGALACLRVRQNYTLFHSSKPCRPSRVRRKQVTYAEEQAPTLLPSLGGPAFCRFFLHRQGLRDVKGALQTEWTFISSMRIVHEAAIVPARAIHGSFSPKPRAPAKSRQIGRIGVAAERN